MGREEYEKSLKEIKEHMEAHGTGHFEIQDQLVHSMAFENGYTAGMRAVIDIIKAG